MAYEEQQLAFDLMDAIPQESLPEEIGRGRNGNANKLDAQDRPFHDWYRFVLSYPPHLVRAYLKNFGLDQRHTVLDPFCGTGTTVVECKLNGIRGVGLEANPFAHFASSVKLDWSIDAEALQAMARSVANSTWQALESQDIRDNEPFARGIQELPLPEIQRIADAIEQRRMEMGKNSGFERMYPKVTKLYFGGMARHLAELRAVLRPGAQLAYVVGDQASYLRVMIRSGQLIADIAQALGYEVVRIDLFRTRLATATREQLREEVVVLRWSGGSN